MKSSQFYFKHFKPFSLQLTFLEFIHKCSSTSSFTKHRVLNLNQNFKNCKIKYKIDIFSDIQYAQISKFPQGFAFELIPGLCLGYFEVHTCIFFCFFFSFFFFFFFFGLCHVNCVKGPLAVCLNSIFQLKSVGVTFLK